MNSDDIQEKSVNASLMKIETLQKEYEVVLQQYQEACQNYISELSSSKDEFVKLPEKTWWGSSSLKETKVENVDQCEEMCFESSKCTGATYNASNQFCWIRQGDTGISSGKKDDTAILPKATIYLVSMKNLNEELLALNNEIDTELTKIRPEVVIQYKEKTEKQKELNEAYAKLNKQKYEIEQHLEEYNSVIEQNVSTSKFVNKEHLVYRFWLMVLMIVLLITIQKLFNFTSTYVFFFASIIVILVLLSQTLTSPSGFMFWFLMIIAIFLYKT
jgi:hypothetical protein